MAQEVRRRGLCVYLVVLVSPLVGVGLATITWAVVRTVQARQTESPQVVDVPSTALLGSHSTYAGNPNAPYTLVEFADYECSPCRSAHPKLRALLARFPNRLRLAYRNLPLSKFHPSAMRAARSAEIARQFGRFSVVHDRLFEADRLDDRQITRILVEQGLDKRRLDMNVEKRAVDYVREDMDMAKRLKVPGTPMFYLCRPDGVVLGVSLNQIAGIIR